MVKMFVSTDGLSLRSAPETDGNTRIAKLSLAHPVDVLGPGGRRGWKRVAVQHENSNVEGFVFDAFLRKPESAAKEALLAETAKEWIRFEKGKGLEHEAPYFRFVGEMWKSIGLPNLDGKDRDQPWSAAFISFVVRNAKYRGFRFAAAHARYIHDSIKKRQSNTRNAPFWGFRITEHKPKLGDLVCQWRVTSQDFDGASQSDSFKSHCDIVVEVRDTFVRAIGGNVGQSVKMKKYALTPRGFLANQNKVFGVLRNNK